MNIQNQNENKNEQKEKHVQFDTHLYEIPPNMNGVEPFEEHLEESFEEFDKKVEDLFNVNNLKTQK